MQTDTTTSTRRGRNGKGALRVLPLPETRAIEGRETSRQRLELALEALVRRQADRGAFPGDYGGALFLTPIYVIAAHVTGYRLDDEGREGILRELRARQNEDGGFGLHAEGPSTVFTTTLAYVALRQLGLGPEDEGPRRARAWLRAHGGALGIPSWGKLILCVAGLYDYAGIHPVLPELWLLPRWVPVQPGRLWCHCRVVYLPMSFLYGIKAQAPVTPLVEALRDELYQGRWASIDWPAARNDVAATDLHTPHSAVLDAVNHLQAIFEGLAPRGLRDRSLEEVLDHIRHEDESTGFIDIGPVNQLLNLLVEHFVAPGSERVRRHHERLTDYLRVDAEGARTQGYNNSELWDTAFALQAMVASEAGRRRHPDALRRGYGFVRDSQVLEDVADGDRYYRHPSKGGWPFSDRPHGWPISDCTGEGLKAALLLEGVDPEATIPEARLVDAARFILSTQNPDGGFPTYERMRGSKLLELLNPSEVFGRIMVDYSYPECTSSCVQGLVLFQRRMPGVLSGEIRTALRRALSYLLRTQRSDGSWYGSWGICFTYATWFGVTGLRAAGLPASHPAIARARRFLLAHQRDDGGWGEHFSSCTTERYVEAEKSQVVQTAWALLALMRAGFVDRQAIDRGVAFLHRRQAADGSFAREAMAGVFNKTCMLNYDSYYQVFPTWALGVYEAERAR